MFDVMEYTDEELRYMVDWLKQFFYEVTEIVEDEDLVYITPQNQIEAIKQTCEDVSEVLNL